jgi:hypothetical protein
MDDYNRRELKRAERQRKLDQALATAMDLKMNSLQDLRSERDDALTEQEKSVGRNIDSRDLASVVSVIAMGFHTLAQTMVYCVRLKHALDHTSVTRFDD